MSFLTTSIQSHWFVIFLFQVALGIGLIYMIQHRNYLINELIEENEALRKIIKRNHDRRKIN